MSSFNDDLPSSADRFVAQYEPEAVEKAAQKIEEAADYVQRQGVQAYGSTNRAVSSQVSPLNGVLIGAVFGFVVGSLWGSRH